MISVTDRGITDTDLYYLAKLLNISIAVLMDDQFYNTGREGCFIVNIQSSDEPGIHWVGVFNDSDMVYVFDSLGYPPDEKILAYANKKNKNVVYSNYKIQGASSAICGLYAMYACYMMDGGGSGSDFDKLLNSFDLSGTVEGREENDERINHAFAGTVERKH